MSEQTDPNDIDDPEGDGEDLSEQEQADRSQRTANQARKARLEAAALKRENAFLRAGVKLSDTQAKALVAYDGPTDDPEKITAWASEMFGESVLPKVEATETDTPSEEVSPEERASTKERQALATGASPDDGRGEDPFAAAAAVREQVVRSGGKREDALAAAVATVRKAAMAGDDRARYQGPRSQGEELTV